MIEALNFDNLDLFLDWYIALNPNESLDMHEAMTVFFSIADYEIFGV